MSQVWVHEGERENAKQALTQAQMIWDEWADFAEVERALIHFGLGLIQADELRSTESPLDFGFHMSFGWKQDNLRITTSSSGLEKTGTTGEISLDTRYRLGSGCALNLNFPVGRPALFGVAFSILQLEPQLTVEFYKQLYKGLELVFGPSVGASFYYGPEHSTDIDELNSSDFFFASGPIMAGLVGLRFNEFFENVIGFRPYYGSLLAENRDYSDFYGGLIEYYVYFN
jgi:hypothetical protein